MQHDLETSIRNLYALDGNQSPVELARQRENTLVAGLHALAAHFGKEIEHTMIDARGDMAFVIKGAREGLGGEYGPELAEILSKVPHRTGVQFTDAALLPENNWCWINHFKVDRLLRQVGEEMFAITRDNISLAGPTL